MENYHSWGKYVRNVWGNVEDDDLQVVLMNPSRGPEHADFSLSLSIEDTGLSHLPVRDAA